MERLWTIAATSFLVSAAWILGPVAWVVHKSSGHLTWHDYLVWAMASCQYRYLFPVALIPLGLITAWWVCPKIIARRDSEVQRLRERVNGREGRIRSQEWDLEKQRVQFETHCQVELHNANETIKAWEREARAKIEVREAKDKVHLEMLHEEIEEQREAANEKVEKLELREDELDIQEKDFEARMAKLDKWQAELGVLKSELTNREQNLYDRERDLDKREQTLIEKEQALNISEEATAIIG